MPEENLLIENEKVHVKVFRAPTGKTHQKKIIFITVLAISTLIVIGGLIIWATHFDQTGESDQNQHQYTAAEIMLRRSNLLHYLSQISGTNTISGIDVSADADAGDGVQLIRNITGVSPGLISTQMPDYTSNDTVWTSFIAEVISNWNNHHLVRIIMWDNPIDRMYNSTNTYDTHERIWEDFIMDGGQFNNVWKEFLDKIAPYLHELQSAGVIPIFDMFPLINWRYEIYRGRPGVNGTARLYKIAHDYLTKQQNLTSLIWNWSLYSDYMTEFSEFEQFWPGSDYVDVASVHMTYEKELPNYQYERLTNLVGDKSLSMDWMYTVPSVQLLAAQPRWTWFTADEYYLQDTDYNNDRNIKATFNSVSVINKGNILFFNDSDLTI